MLNVRLYAIILIALLVSACGGGGGGGGDAPAPAAVVTSVDTRKCPDGGPIPQAGTSACAVVVTSVVDLVKIDRVVLKQQGVTFAFSGTIDPATVNLDNIVLKKGDVNGVPVVGSSVALAADGKHATYIPLQIPAANQPYVITLAFKDTVGREVTTNTGFTTPPMVCADNAIWSNPATFSTMYQDCVADIGVQTLVNASFNTLQDDTCTITLSTPLTSACKAYMANGTMILSNTSVVVVGHATIWMAYIGMDAKSNTVLLDANDPKNLVPVGTLVLPSSLVSITGNPSGESIRIETSVAGVIKTEQVTWNAGSSTLAVTCLKNC